MKLSAEVGPSSIPVTPNFVKIGRAAKKLDFGNTHTHTHTQITLYNLISRSQESSYVVVCVSFITNRCSSAPFRFVVSFCLTAVKKCKTAEGIFMLLATEKFHFQVDRP